MAVIMLSQVEAKSLAYFSLYSRSLLRVAALFCRASKVAVTGANWLPMVTESLGEALSVMVFPRLERIGGRIYQIVVSMCVYVYLKERMYIGV